MANLHHHRPETPTVRSFRRLRRRVAFLATPVLIAACGDAGPQPFPTNHDAGPPGDSLPTARPPWDVDSEVDVPTDIPAGSEETPDWSSRPWDPEDSSELSTALSGSAGASAGGAPGDDEASVPALVISQYLEGEGSLKALELTNVGVESLDLARCEIAIYANGATTPYRRATLEGGLGAGVSFTLCSTKLAGAAPTACDASSGSLVFNGNDAIVLSCQGATVDSFGRVGEDPGAAWGAEVSTKDGNLERRCDAFPGDANPEDPFFPEDQWVSRSFDGLEGLGEPGCADAALPAMGGAGGASGWLSGD